MNYFGPCLHFYPSYLPHAIGFINLAKDSRSASKCKQKPSAKISRFLGRQWQLGHALPY